MAQRKVNRPAKKSKKSKKLTGKKELAKAQTLVSFNLRAGGTT